MSEKKSNWLIRDILIAIIGSIVAGIVIDHFFGLWRVLLFIWHVLTAKVGVPVWLPGLFIIIFGFLFYLVARIAIRGFAAPAFVSYRADSIYGIRWRWGYQGNQITEPEVFCPNCQMRLIIRPLAKVSWLMRQVAQQVGH